MYCPAANLVSPYNEPTTQLAEKGYDNEDGESKKPEVTLEQDKDGNSFLHLILPAASVNFLNGHDPNSLFDVDSQERGGYNSTVGETPGGIDEDFDEMLIEVGCKVYEINRVLYKSTPSDSNDFSL